MINEIFVVIGMIIMLISAVICSNLIIKVKEKISWLAVFVLIVFFLTGYIVYFIINLKNTNNFTGGDFLISQILFWGSVFVVLVLFVSQRMFLHLDSTIKNLENLNEKYEEQKESLKQIQLRISEKNKKLEEVVDDFYNYPLGSKNGSTEEVKLKNIRLKDKIEKLKNKR